MAELDIFDLMDQLSETSFMGEEVGQKRKTCEDPAIAAILNLLQNHPNAAKQVNARGRTPLHAACYDGAPLEVVSALLNVWPGATREKAKFNSTPLHDACDYVAPLEVVSALLNVWPDAAKEKNRFGLTPLHK
eukprot:11805608-Ditylum_brightwellii.AAC.2